MAWIVGDGFDYYNGNADLAHSVWDSVPSAPDMNTSGRFSPSQCIHYGGIGTPDLLVKSFGSNESTVYVALAFYAENALSASNPMFTIRLTDGGTNQCSITFGSDGAIRLRSGSGTGTVLATYTGAFVQTLWAQFQIQVVLNSTTGSITIRKNGATSTTFTATGLNTCGGTANNYANGIVLANSTVMSWGWRVDDFLCFSSSGAAPNTWVGDIRAICLMPVADTAQKNFTPVPGGTITFQASNAIGLNFSAGANTLYTCAPVAPTRGGALQKLTMISMGAATGHVQAAVYANDGPGGAPGTLLGTSAVVTNPPASGNVDFTFSTAVTLSPIRQYYFAFLQDVAWGQQVMSASPGYSVARSYSAGFPNPAGAMSAISGYLPYLSGTIGGNSLMVSELLANGDTDYVQSSNVNDEDLYQLDTLPVVPAAIIGVVTKGYLKKSDAGTRQGQVRMKSGTTEVAGVDTAVSTSYAYLARVDTVDPNTSATWTNAAVNALQVGVKVTL